MPDFNAFREEAIKNHPEEEVDAFIEQAKQLEGLRPEPQSFDLPQQGNFQLPSSIQQDFQLNDEVFDSLNERIPQAQSSANLKDGIIGVDAPLTQRFGNRNPKLERFSGGINQGADFAVPRGTPLFLPEGQWEVRETFNKAREGNRRTNNGSGNVTRVRNTRTGEELLYEHLSVAPHKLGTILKGGEVAGLSGNTGNSTGPHASIAFRDARGRLRDVQSRFNI